MKEDKDSKQPSASRLNIQVNVTGTELFQEIAQLLRDVSVDERVPVQVREEIKDKVFSLLDSRDDEQ